MVYVILELLTITTAAVLGNLLGELIALWWVTYRMIPRGSSN